MGFFIFGRTKIIGKIVSSRKTPPVCGLVIHVHIVVNKQGLYNLNDFNSNVKTDWNDVLKSNNRVQKCNESRKNVA